VHVQLSVVGGQHRLAVAAGTRRPTSRAPVLPAQPLDSYTPRTLRYEVRSRGRLPVAECVRIGLALTTALEHVHQHGLVHRDVKASNVVFVRGVPKLADIDEVSTDLCSRITDAFVIYQDRNFTHDRAAFEGWPRVYQGMMNILNRDGTHAAALDQLAGYALVYPLD
jgi:hypothetical protein